MIRQLADQGDEAQQRQQPKHTPDAVGQGFHGAGQIQPVGSPADHRQIPARNAHLMGQKAAVQHPVQQIAQGTDVHLDAGGRQLRLDRIQHRGGIQPREILDQFSRAHPGLIRSHLRRQLHPGQCQRSQTSQQQQTGYDFHAHRAFPFP